MRLRKRTLRVGAIAAAVLQPDMPELLMIEDIEKDVDPARLRLLVELLKAQALQTGRQIIVTTRSPAVLAGLSDQDYETTFLASVTRAPANPSSNRSRRFHTS